jgi:membrane-associated protease RseP (regulator of RpoE activity)
MNEAFSFRALGYPVSVGWGGIVIVALWGFMSAGNQVNAYGLVMAILTALVVGVSILGHELGHAVVADRFGMRSPRIQLHGLGGHCAYGGYPTAGQRVWIALAGPGAGFLLGGLALAGSFAIGKAGMAPPPLVLHAVGMMVWVNIVWSVFNLLPMQPLDGSTALLAGLRTRIPARRASEIARWVSLATAGIVGLLALSWGQNFVFILAAISFYQTWTGARLL